MSSYTTRAHGITVKCGTQLLCNCNATDSVVLIKTSYKKHYLLCNAPLPCNYNATADSVLERQ